MLHTPRNRKGDHRKLYLYICAPSKSVHNKDEKKTERRIKRSVDLMRQTGAFRAKKRARCAAESPNAELPALRLHLEHENAMSLPEKMSGFLTGTVPYIIEESLDILDSA
jgi:hypothetical protein